MFAWLALRRRSALHPGAQRNRKKRTLKLMIGLLKPDHGEVGIQNRGISGLDQGGVSEVHRQMGFLFQNAALFDSFTLNDNLLLPLQRFKTKPRAEFDASLYTTLCRKR